MEKERSYGFRHFLNTVHKPDRRDHGVKAKKGEVLVDDSWSIVVPEKAERLVVTAAKDLQDYLFTSMNVSVPLKRHADLAGKGGRRILLAAGGDLPEAGEKLTVPRSFVLACGEESISVRGFDARGVAQGCYYIEDVMNLREAPLVGKTSGLRREPLFSPRMVHSGWGIDQFPDGHLHAMAHAGFDAVLVFAKGPDKTTAGYLDFNELVDRAASFGLDVYLYSYLKSSKHPDDPGAKEFYESTYGELFRQCPRAKGVVLVGESCEFPSKDTVNTSGKPWDQSQDHGIPCPKPSPGWWPCLDYPQWLDMVKKAVRKHNPDADVIFWTYNWGWAPEADRLKLVKALPTDVSLQVTFEMFEQIRRGGVADMVMDYTISSPGPGAYFVSEAKAAKKRGLRLYTMSNTGGMTWDFGVAPYVPAPFQWARRHEALHHARRSWGLSGLMESHHYGWYPSVVSEAAKWSFWSNSPDTEELLGRIAARDFGAKAAPHAVKAWREWSDAMNDYVPSNEDQYGPFRVGPSYPLVFHPDVTRTMQSKEIAFPSAPHAHFGGAIVKTFYHPFECLNQSAGPRRIEVEIEVLGKMLKRWEGGLEQLGQALKLAPARKRAEAAKALGLGKFIRNSIATTINVKNWWVLNQRLLSERDQAKSLALLEEIAALAERELANAADTIPLVEADSRLGWEPSMEYMTDKWHLEWKIRQVRNVIDHEIPAYRKIIST